MLRTRFAWVAVLVAVRGLHRFALREGIVGIDVASDVHPPSLPRRLPKALPVDDVLRLCVLAGYPDRVAKRRKQGSRDLAMAGGGLAELSEDSAVRDAEWLVAVDAENARGAARVRVASAIEPGSKNFMYSM